MNLEQGQVLADVSALHHLVDKRDRGEGITKQEIRKTSWLGKRMEEFSK